jgi:hypothetical protein
MREGKRPKGLPHLAAIESSFSRTILEVILIPLPCIFSLLFFFFFKGERRECAHFARA